jgi:uncharacterized damage-inducible protein DinB
MTEETAKGLAEYLLPQLQHEYVTTCKVLAAVPADQSGYKPSEKCMTGLELAGHIAMAEVFFLRGVSAGAFEWKQVEFKTPEEVLAYYIDTVPGLLAAAAALPAEKLAQNIEVAVWNQPAVAYLSLCMSHGIHHRGQLSSYLRPMGAKVPSIYGASGDEPKAAAATE